MHRFPLSFIVLVALLLAAAVALIAPRSNLAQPLETASADEPAVAYMMIGPADFVPSQAGQPYLVNPMELSANLLITQTFLAPLHLPEGATVVSMKSNYGTFENSRDIHVSLTYSDFPDGSSFIWRTMAELNLDAASGRGPKETTTISSNVIDNSVRRYTVMADFWAGTGTRAFLYYVRIGYTLAQPVFMPLVNKGTP